MTANNYAVRWKQASVQIVSVWAKGKRLCLAQSQIADKTNEIKAIPELLTPLDITGIVVSIDAIGFQKKLPKLIFDKKADCNHWPKSESGWVVSTDGGFV